MFYTVLYQFFLYGVPLAVVGALFGFRWREGLWGNVLSAMNVFFAFLIAVAYWEALAVFLAKNLEKILFFADFLAFWGIFLLTLLIFSEITRLLSRVNVQFPDPVEKAGNSASLTVLSLVLLCAYYFSLNLSPVGEKPETSVPSGRWTVATHKLVQVLSAGSLSAFANPHPFPENFRAQHLKRKQAIMKNAEDNKGSVLFSGTVPSR